MSAAGPCSGSSEIRRYRSPPASRSPPVGASRAAAQLPPEERWEGPPHPSPLVTRCHLLLPAPPTARHPQENALPFCRGSGASSPKESCWQDLGWAGHLIPEQQVLVISLYRLLKNEDLYHFAALCFGTSWKCVLLWTATG